MSSLVLTTTDGTMISVDKVYRGQTETIIDVKAHTGDSDPLEFQMTLDEAAVDSLIFMLRG